MDAGGLLRMAGPGIPVMTGQRKKAGEAYETMPATICQYSDRRLMFCSKNCEGDRVKTFHRLDTDTRLCRMRRWVCASCGIESWRLYKRFYAETR